MKFSRKFFKIFENMFEGEKVDIISKKEKNSFNYKLKLNKEIAHF